jgi:hypothetical protein
MVARRAAVRIEGWGFDRLDSTRLGRGPNYRITRN